MTDGVSADESDSHSFEQVCWEWVALDGDALRSTRLLLATANVCSDDGRDDCRISPAFLAPADTSTTARSCITCTWAAMYPLFETAAAVG
jgi:hypothetical protein